MKELLPLPEASVRQLPGSLRTVQHHPRTQNVGLNKHLHVSTDEVYGSLPDDDNAYFYETSPYEPASLSQMSALTKV